MTIRLVLADDHLLFRRGLRGLLDDMDGMEVVAEAENGQQAVQLTRRLQPDCVLLDVHMPVLDGCGAVSLLRQAGFAGGLIMLTVSQADEDLVCAIRAGADAYLLKNISPDELQRTIRAVLAGEAVLSPEMIRKAFAALRRGRDDWGGLSEREWQILRAIQRGQTTAEIAAALFISINTVKTHVRHIFAKLEVSDRRAAVRKAEKMGILPPSG